MAAGYAQHAANLDHTKREDREPHEFLDEVEKACKPNRLAIVIRSVRSAVLGSPIETTVLPFTTSA